MKRNAVLLTATLLAASIGCSSAKKDGAAQGATNGGAGATPSSNGSSGNAHAGSSAGSGANAMSGSGGGGSAPSATGSKPGSAAPDAMDGGSSTKPPATATEMLDPKIDWTALTLIYAPMYSAYDGMHTFQVPVHVDGTTIDLSGWQAIPSDAVTFDADPDGGGVLVTIVKGEPEITIAASTGKIGGTAVLKVTVGTPDDWNMGEARYHNNVEFTLDIDFSMALLDPNWMPPPPPPNLACNNCHSSGAKYFEIQHTPTQCARFSDDDLKTIFTTGKKPPGIGFRVLPAMLGDMTAEEVYAGFHKWDATEAEIKGLIVYLRSLTPTGQGDILLPDGTYVAPGTPLDAGLGGSQ